MVVAGGSCCRYFNAYHNAMYDDNTYNNTVQYDNYAIGHRNYVRYDSSRNNL